MGPPVNRELTTLGALVASAAVSKKLEEKQRRRLAEERKKDALKKAQRKRTLVTTVVALVVGAAVVGAILVQKKDRERELIDYGVSESDAKCGDVQEQEEQGAQHIEVGSAHEPYTTTPPTSGPHYNSAGLGPVQPDFYEDATEAPPEGVVHNLEHGQIVFYYNPDAPDEVINDLQLAVRDEPLASVATPFADLPDDANFVMAAWTVSQACEQVSKVAVNEFREAYQGITGPEKLTQPFDG
jgi:Protein of unknown function (DUF3105)